MVFFTRSSLMITLSGSTSFSLLVSLAVMGSHCSISIPLLRVIMDFTSSIPELLDEPTSWTPFGFGNVWEGNLPLFCTSSNLLIFVIKYCRLCFECNLFPASYVAWILFWLSCVRDVGLCLSLVDILVGFLVTLFVGFGC